MAGLDDGLVAYYPFDGNINDATGNGNNAIEHGGIEYVEGIQGKAAKFDGVQDYMEVISGMNFTSNMSVSFYMKVESHNGASIFQKGESCPDGNPSYKGAAYSISIGKHYNEAYTSSGQGFLNISAVETNGNYFDDRVMVSTNEQIPTSSLDHYVVIFKDNFFKVYINGTLVSSSTKYEHGGSANTVEISSSEFSGIHQTDATLKIGVHESYCGHNHTYSSYFSGILDEVRFYNKVLSNSEILELYQSDISITPNPNPSASCSAGTVSPNLSVHMPSLEYQTLTGTQNIWVDFDFYGQGSNGEMLWKLRDFGINQ